MNVFVRKTIISFICHWAVYGICVSSLMCVSAGRLCVLLAVFSHSYLFYFVFSSLFANSPLKMIFNLSTMTYQQQQHQLRSHGKATRERKKNMRRVRQTMMTFKLNNKSSSTRCACAVFHSIHILSMSVQCVTFAR